MTEEMILIDNSSIPEQIDIWSNTEQILKKLKAQREQENKIFEPDFKNFWLYCEMPIPVVFKYGNRYFITRDKSKIKDGEKLDKKDEMTFVDSATVPTATRGKKSKDWSAILSKIPIGKSWIPNEKNFGVSTLRKAITELEKAKKAKVGEFTVVQRTTENTTKTYVSHVAVKP